MAWPQSLNFSRVPSSFFCLSKYLLYVPITLSLSLAPAVMAYLSTAEMIINGGSSDQGSIQPLITTRIKIWRILRKSLVLKIKKCKYVIMTNLDVHQPCYLALSEPSTVVMPKAITPHGPTSPVLNLQIWAMFHKSWVPKVILDWPSWGWGLITDR